MKFSYFSSKQKGIKELIYRIADLLDELPIPESPVEEKLVFRPDFKGEKEIEVKDLTVISMR